MGKIVSRFSAANAAHSAQAACSGADGGSDPWLALSAAARACGRCDSIWRSAPCSPSNSSSASRQASQRRWGEERRSERKENPRSTNGTNQDCDMPPALSLEMNPINKSQQPRRAFMQAYRLSLSVRQNHQPRPLRLPPALLVQNCENTGTNHFLCPTSRRGRCVQRCAPCNQWKPRWNNHLRLKNPTSGACPLRR